jgi:predicted transposase YbfD/YdcC
MTAKLTRVFSQVEDPRRDITKLHQLNDILLISILAVICGAETWKNIETFASSKVDFLSTFLELPNGITKLDPYSRVFAAIDSEQFESCFIEWVGSLADISKGQVVAIDGKTLRGAKDHTGKSSIHMVSAWACQSNLVLGQVKVNEKSNEITAIPKLLEIISLEGNTVTIDAMGCQTKIVDKIIAEKANYIIAIKGNQKTFYKEIQEEFRLSKDIHTTSTCNLDHGRIETRTCSVISVFKYLKSQHKWRNLKSIVRIVSSREFKNSNKITETATRFYISSLEQESESFNKDIRSHWAIENKLHWTLDVAFSEDASRKRIGNSAQNFSILNKVALNLLKNEKTAKQGVKSKRFKAALDNEYLKKVLHL